MVLGSNLATDDTLNLPNTGCCGVVNTSRFESPWRVLKAWQWNVPRLSKKKKEKKLWLGSQMKEEIEVGLMWLDSRMKEEIAFDFVYYSILY